MPEKSPTLWVLSNRVDDRIVLWERDPAHPGGEAFVGGSAPAFVGRTGEIERLLHAGLLLEVPEPQDGPKKPIVPVATDEAPLPPALPGQPARLGRKLDPDLFPESVIAKVEDRQEQLPDEIRVPDGTIVPQPEPPQRESRRR